MIPIFKLKLQPRSIALQVRQISNYYRYFPETLAKGPPPSGKFAIDVKKLRSEYLKAQRHAHPDVAGESSQITSAELSTAFRTLQDPVSRAEHILALRNENPLVEGAASLEDEDLLMEIMMSREQVSESETIEELTPIIEQAEQKFREVESSLSTALEKDDIQTARQKLVELTYLAKLNQAADQRSEELRKN